VPQEHTTTSPPVERVTESVEPPTDGAVRRGPWTTLRPLLRPIGIFAGSRVAVLASMWLTYQLSPGGSPTQVFLRWDASWYYLVILVGYSPDPPPDQAGVYAFFPAFPMTARALAALPGIGPIDAGLFVAGVASFLAAVAIWVLCRHVTDQATADRAVALFAFFPASFVLSMLYSEGVMLALSAACIWALLRHKWLLAGVLAALGTASRPNAIALIAVCAWAAGAAIISRREWRALVAPALAPLGVLAYFGFLWARTGSPLTWFRVQRGFWHESVTPFALVRDVREFVAAPFGNTNNTAVIVGAVVCAVGLYLLLRSDLPAVLTVYSAVVIALAVCSETLGPRPRFVLTAFPIFFVFALRLRGTAFATALGISATVLGAFTLISLDSLLFTP